jgi:hypothetical protein
MTLEQIKNRQEQLNEYLSIILKDSVNTVGKEDEIYEVSIPIQESNGLLEQLSYQQDRTELLISQLSNNHNTLSHHTYAPVQCEDTFGK